MTGPRVGYLCVCGKRSEWLSSMNDIPDGWMSARLYFDGRFRVFLACSADCVRDAKEADKAHYRERVEGLCRRIDEMRLERAKP